MAQRTSDGSSRGSSGSSRGASRRLAAAPVKKPFPWGFAAGAVALVLVLGGILFYAATNTGSGFQTALDKLDDTFSRLQVTENAPANHVGTRVDYPDAATQAPDSGNHNQYPQTCAVYTAAIVPEHAVHSLEHGAVWVTYRPDLPEDQVATLADLVEGNPYRMLSPYPGQTAAVALQAWGRRLDVDSADDPAVERFLDGYTDGPQSREKGASCSGVDQPGTVPFVPGPDGATFVPGGDTGASVPADEADVPEGTPGSAAPGSAAPAPPAAVPPAAVPPAVAADAVAAGRTAWPVRRRRPPAARRAGGRSR